MIIPLFIGVWPSQVVQDFVHQQYWTTRWFRPSHGSSILPMVFSMIFQPGDAGIHPDRGKPGVFPEIQHRRLVVKCNDISVFFRKFHTQNIVWEKMRSHKDKEVVSNRHYSRKVFVLGCIMLDPRKLKAAANPNSWSFGKWVPLSGVIFRWTILIFRACTLLTRRSCRSIGPMYSNRKAAEAFGGCTHLDVPGQEVRNQWWTDQWVGYNLGRLMEYIEVATHWS